MPDGSARFDSFLLIASAPLLPVREAQAAFGAPQVNLEEVS
jgi:hypothetical protein